MSINHFDSDCLGDLTELARDTFEKRYDGEHVRNDIDLVDSIAWVAAARLVDEGIVRKQPAVATAAHTRLKDWLAETANKGDLFHEEFKEFDGLHLPDSIGYMFNLAVREIDKLTRYYDILMDKVPDLPAAAEAIK